VLPRLVDDLDGDSEQARAPAPEAFGVIEDAVTAAAGFEPSFGARHRGAPRSTLRKEDFYPLLERCVDPVAVSQAAQTLSALLLHVVVAAPFGALDAPRAGHAEALRGGAVRFHLGHGRLFRCLARPRLPLSGARPAGRRVSGDCRAFPMRGRAYLA